MGQLWKENPLIASSIHTSECNRKELLSGKLPWTADIPDKHPDFCKLATSTLHGCYSSHSEDGKVPSDADSRLACEQFLAFFRTLENWQLRLTAWISDLLTLTFARTSQSCRLLHAEFEKLKRMFRRKPWISVNHHSYIAVLLSTACKAFECAATPLALRNYLLWLNTYVIQQDKSLAMQWWSLCLDQGYRSSSSSQVPSRVLPEEAGFGQNGPAPGERLWFVSRMLGVSKTMRPSNWEAACTTLLDFLVGLAIPRTSPDSMASAAVITHVPSLDEDGIKEDFLIWSSELYGEAIPLAPGLPMR